MLRDSAQNHESTPAAIMHTSPCHLGQGKEEDTPTKQTMGIDLSLNVLA